MDTKEPFYGYDKKERDSVIKAGYKQTEAGVIPEDWECVAAGDVIQFFGGYGFSSDSESTSGVRWLKIANVGVEKIKWEAESFLPSSFLSEFKSYSLNSGDVVMALTRPILNDKLKIARLDGVDQQFSLKPKN